MINPNTAHRIVAQLIREQLLIARPGIGTIVARSRPGLAAARRALLGDRSERLVVDARRAGLSLQDVTAAIRQHWLKMARAAS